MADIYSTLKKIKALADVTNFEAEKESALELLQRLMDKHGITEQDLNDDAVARYEFHYRNDRESHLLQQIFCKVLNSGNLSIYSYIRGGKKLGRRVGLDCTATQSIEIKFLFDFYRRLYAKEEKAFYHAFIQKHRLFRETVSDEEMSGDPLSPEEYEKMLNMMNGMDDATPLKQITDGGKQ